MATPKKDRPAGGDDRANTPGGSEARPDSVQGEGDYRSAREFNQAEREFVESHDTEELGRRAAPEGSDEAAELERAEDEGKSHARADTEDDMDRDADDGDLEQGHS